MTVKVRISGQIWTEKMANLITTTADFEYLFSLDLEHILRTTKFNAFNVDFLNYFLSIAV